MTTFRRLGLVAAICMAIASAFVTPNTANAGGDITTLAPWEQMAQSPDVTGWGAYNQATCPTAEEIGSWPLDAQRTILSRDPKNVVLAYGILVSSGGNMGNGEPPYWRFTIYLGHLRGKPAMPMMLLEDKRAASCVHGNSSSAKFVDSPPRIRFLSIGGSWPASHGKDYSALIGNIWARLNLRGLAICGGPLTP